jgi:hypothetical protein
VATAGYYALPDVISSRSARGWAKAGLTAVAVAASVPDLREAWATAREGWEREVEADPSKNLRSQPLGTRILVLGSVAGVLTCTAGGMLIAERWVFRRGQARAASGKRLPHTGPALLYGALASALWLLPPPSDPR